MKKTILALNLALGAFGIIYAQTEAGEYIDGIYYESYIDRTDGNEYAAVAYGTYPNGCPENDIIIPPTVNFNSKILQVKKLAEGALDWTKYHKVKSIILPEGITSLETCAIGEPMVNDEYRRTVSVDLPESIEYLYNSCLSSIVLKEQLNLPNIRSVGPMALADSPIKRLTLGSNLSSVGRMAFMESDIEELIFEDGNHTDFFNGMNPYLSNGAFHGMKIKELKLPKWENMAIGDCVATSCNELERVVFPDIPYFEYGYNFYCYQNVTSIVGVYDYFFRDCPKLNEIVCLGTEPPIILGLEDFASINVCRPNECQTFEFMDNIDNCILKVPAGSEQAYRNDPVWGKFKTILGFENGDYTSISSVPSADSNDAVPVYYNLQGIKVSNPAKGQLYIRATGSTAEKVIF